MLLGVLGAGIALKELTINREPPKHEPRTASKNKATEPLQFGTRHFDLSPMRVQTRALLGDGVVDMSLLSVTVGKNGLEITLRVKAGDGGDLLMYEPPGSKTRTRNVFGVKTTVDSEFEELYIVDDLGTKHYSTTGFLGGSQESFNNYNFIQAIRLSPQEAATITCKFPLIDLQASTITFISPNLNGWQPEWRWKNIPLR